MKWPTRPVQVIVPAGAGGDTDFNARQMARYFEKLAGKPMVVTNVNGGGGTIAMSQVQDAAPDGNTVFFGHTGMLIVNEVSGLIDYKFDAKLDIACVPAVDKGIVFIGSKKSGLKTVQDVVTKAKAQPNTVNLRYRTGRLLSPAGTDFCQAGWRSVESRRRRLGV